MSHGPFGLGGGTFRPAPAGSAIVRATSRATFRECNASKSKRKGHVEAKTVGVASYSFPEVDIPAYGTARTLSGDEPSLARRLPRQGGYDQQPGAWMLQQRLSSLSPRASDTRVSGIIYRTLMDAQLALMPWSRPLDRISLLVQRSTGELRI